MPCNVPYVSRFSALMCFLGTVTLLWQSCPLLVVNAHRPPVFLSIKYEHKQYLFLIIIALSAIAGISHHC